MVTTYHLTPRAHLLLAIEALKFAMEQKAVSGETRRKTGIALASARATSLGNAEKPNAARANASQHDKPISPPAAARFAPCQRRC